MVFLIPVMHSQEIQHKPTTQIKMVMVTTQMELSEMSAHTPMVSPHETGMAAPIRILMVGVMKTIFFLKIHPNGVIGMAMDLATN